MECLGVERLSKGCRVAGKYLAVGGDTLIFDFAAPRYLAEKD